MPQEERWTEIDGLQIHYSQAGQGRPLLLIHGLLGGSFCWRFNIPVLAKQYAVYAVDLPGSGLSDARSYPEEFHTYEVSGVVQLTRNEDDHDVHIALADPGNSSQTIVVEVADPACPGAAQSPFATTLTQARAEYSSLGSLTGGGVNLVPQRSVNNG